MTSERRGETLCQAEDGGSVEVGDNERHVGSAGSEATAAIRSSDTSCGDDAAGPSVTSSEVSAPR